MELFELAERYNRLLDRKAEISNAEKENNKQLETAKQLLCDAMVEAESPRFSYQDFAFSLQNKTKYSKKAGDDEGFFDLLRETGLGDIIRETVNAQTLQSAISAQVEEIGVLPEEFQDYINVYEFYDVARRKETSTALKK